MNRRATILALSAAAALSVSLSASAGADPTPPDHHHIICDSATLYAHYAEGSGPFEPMRTLARDNQVGHTYGSGEGETHGWIYVQDFGPNDWGWVLGSCVSQGV